MKERESQRFESVVLREINVGSQQKLHVSTISYIYIEMFVKIIVFFVNRFFFLNSKIESPFFSSRMLAITLSS